MPAPIPWTAIAMGASALLPLLFGGKNQQTQVTETEIPPTGFQDPMLPVMSPMILQMLLKNMQAWGGPSGPKGTTGTFFSPGMMGDILKLIGGEWPKVLAGARGEDPQSRRPAGLFSKLPARTRG